MFAPSYTLLKTWSALTRWLLAAVLVFWVVLGVAWGTLHWLIVPRIDQFRPQLQAQAARALGVPVRLGAIVARSNGLVPSFELSNVELFDAQGRVALNLSRVLVSLSPRSLWRLGFEQVYIESPTLDVRRLADGRVTVAGFEVASAANADAGALNWFFSQYEFVIANGVVRYSDELRGAPALTLQQVDVVVRNAGRHHDLQMDATPPPDWGERVSLRGKFMQPLLELQHGRWQQWEGQLFVACGRLDLARLPEYADLGFELRQGVGALRAWVDVSRAHVSAAVADVALEQVELKLGADVQELALQQVQGRLGLRNLSGGLELFSRALTFDTRDGLHWPGGNLRWLSLAAQKGQQARGELQADQLDLAALAQIADRLPLQAAWHQQLAAFAPKGLVDSLSVSWQGEPMAPTRYRAQGQLRQLELAAQAPLPGVRGLAADFELDQDGGRARLSLAHGSVDLAGVLHDSLVTLDQASAQARWQRHGEDLSLEVSDLQFANADAQGKAQVKWRTSDPQRTGGGRSRFPGWLDVQASLSRADARQVHRYLPLAIDPAVRDYLRQALLAGSAHDVTFAIQGDIDQMPAVDARQGVFRIRAPFSHVNFAYVPRFLQDAAEAPWPTLLDASGEVLISANALQVKGVQARLGDGGALQVLHAQASIADLLHARVQVDAGIKGPLPQALKLVRTSALNALTGQALAQTTASGNTDVSLQLTVPVAEPQQSTVRASVHLPGNDVQLNPDTPRLTRARGVLNVTERGVTLSGVQARLLGGDARLDGGLQFSTSAPEAARAAPATIQIAGVATAEGLRQAAELGFVVPLARYFNGSTSYSASVGMRRNLPEVRVISELQGLSTSLPAPLQKAAATALPLRLYWGPAASAVPTQERIELTLGRELQVIYERDTATTPARITRGLINAGAEAFGTLTVPTQGVHANVSATRLDLDAWSNVGKQLGWVGSAGGTQADSRAVGYLPSILGLRTDSLLAGGREYRELVLGAEREGMLWRVNVLATELNGYLEYRLPSDSVAGSGGRLYARLARLTLAPEAASEVESLMDAQPASIPALDVVVDDFKLRGKHLGRLEVEAINRLAQTSGGVGGVREWRLNKLNLSVPEATLTASGNWARLNAQAPSAGSAAPERRRTVLNFRLDIADGGTLLERFGMAGVVRQGSGKIEGQAAWVGSPLKPDYPTLGGALTVNVISGQFLKADPGLAKLLGVLSLQALPRRLTLDFRDVFSEGFAFDFLRGDVALDKGIARTNNLQMKGVNAAVLMDGQANLALETQDLKVVVVPEINAGTASLIATVINPAVGIGSFLAQWLLRRPLMESATQEFHIDGSWADPQVRKLVAPAASTKENHP